ncbi:hypothetical protein Tco_0313009 [Tanacetum coccineum]
MWLNRMVHAYQKQTGPFNMLDPTAQPSFIGPARASLSTQEKSIAYRLNFGRNRTRWKNGYEEGMKNCNQNVETTYGKDATPSGECVTSSEECVTPSGSAINNEALETLAWRRRLDYL